MRRLVFDKPAVRVRPKELQTFLDKLKVRQAQEEIQAAKFDTFDQALSKRAKQTFKMDAESLSFVSVGVNMILLMFTGFVVCWYLARQAFGEESLWPLVFGLVGLSAAMLLEVLLFIVRDAKNSQREQEIQKNRQETRRRQEMYARSQAMKDHTDKLAAEAKLFSKGRGKAVPQTNGSPKRALDE
eukprot:CAMPEP_0175121046 /NCGR_PEP_ID=MMETSP0087-20121206/952_1 /TAXON_ID=136419 /ORGANISM="Unknown Unknown, Strain D1" /LENGTH=184 /DNA_ID=CAMNT_0016402547 /DNA_START=280 /DNA_END=833 /DNA_ORIENTATION=+